MKKIHPDKTMKKVIDGFYHVFDYPAPTDKLNVCLHCCMADETEEQMRTLPLKKLTQKHFYDYNSSAKNEIECPSELKYFLPRMVEIFCEGGEIHFEKVLSFERVKNCNKADFTSDEWVLWGKFANAYLDNLLRYYPYECFDFVRDNIFAVLLMFSIAHVDISPFLKRWKNTNTPQAVAHYVYASWTAYWRDDGFDVEAGFWDYSEDFVTKVELWLQNPKNKSYYASQIASLNKEVIQDIEYLGDFYPQYLNELLDKLTKKD